MATSTRRVSTEQALLARPKDGRKYEYVLDKVGEYLEAGVRMVWVIDPRSARAVRYRSVGEVREVGPDDSLDGEDVLPGFRCLLRDVL